MNFCSKADESKPGELFAVGAAPNLPRLQAEIAAWSYQNFGQQRAKHGSLCGVALGQLAPLMGVAEELGELAASAVDNNTPEILDALADIGIYTMDYCGRECICWQATMTFPRLYRAVANTANPGILITIAVGQLFHATLKQAQGIRGFDDPARYYAKRDYALSLLWCGLVGYAAQIGFDYYKDALLPTAAKVLKRDWVKEPVNAAANVPQVQDTIPE